MCLFVCVHIRFPPITEDVLLQAFEVKPVVAVFIDQTLAISQSLLEEVIRKTAFLLLLLFLEVLDKEKKGYLESEELKNYLTQEGRNTNVFAMHDEEMCADSILLLFCLLLR